MPPKVLRRCSLCNNFHASYLVEDKQQGKLYLCYACWTRRQAARKPPEHEKNIVDKRTGEDKHDNDGGS